MQNFIVVGAFRTGLFEQDRSWIYMPLSAAQEYLDLLPLVLAQAGRLQGHDDVSWGQEFGQGPARAGELLQHHHRGDQTGVDAATQKSTERDIADLASIY